MWWRPILILSSQVCLPMRFRWSCDILFKVLYIDTFAIFFMHAACLSCLVCTDLTMNFLWYIILSVPQYYVHNFFVRLIDQVTNWWPCHASVSWQPVTLGLSSIAGQSVWDLWWTKWHSDKCVSKCLSFPMFIVPPVHYTHLCISIQYNHIWQNC